MAETITEMLEGKTPAEKALIKAEQLVLRLQSRLPYQYTLGGLTITVQTVAVRDGCLAVTLTAHDGSGYLPVPDYARGEAYLFRNPPVMRRIDDEVAVEDPLSVAEAFVRDAVVAYARNRGWDG